MVDLHLSKIAVALLHDRRHPTADSRTRRGAPLPLRPLRSLRQKTRRNGQAARSTADATGRVPPFAFFAAKNRSTRLILSFREGRASSRPRLLAKGTTDVHGQVSLTLALVLKCASASAARPCWSVVRLLPEDSLCVVPCCRFQRTSNAGSAYRLNQAGCSHGGAKNSNPDPFDQLAR